MSAKQINDTDFCNVIRDIADVAHHTAATPKKARRGIRSDHVSELEKAKRNLREDMQRLLTSPHALPHAQPPLELSRNATAAMRSLWTVLQDMKNVAPGEAGFEEKAKSLEAAVHRAVTALDPSHTFPEENMEAAEDKKAPEQMPRKSEHLAPKPRRRYDEQEDETEMVALMGANDGDDDEQEDEIEMAALMGADDDEGEETEGGQGTYHV